MEQRVDSAGVMPQFKATGSKVDIEDKVLRSVIEYSWKG
jgi:hypothetical protein